MASSSKGTSEQQSLSWTSGSMVSDGHILCGSVPHKALTLLWLSNPYSFIASAMNRKVLCGKSGCSTKMARPGILGCTISCTYGQSKENSVTTMALSKCHSYCQHPPPELFSLMLSHSQCHFLKDLPAEHSPSSLRWCKCPKFFLMEFLLKVPSPDLSSQLFLPRNHWAEISLGTHEMGVVNPQPPQERRASFLIYATF